jgi:acyl-CoA thioesterase-1
MTRRAPTVEAKRETEGLTRARRSWYVFIYYEYDVIFIPYVRIASGAECVWRRRGGARVAHGPARGGCTRRRPGKYGAPLRKPRMEVWKQGMRSMRKTFFRVARVACLLAGLIAGAWAQGTPAKTVTLRSLGAVGNGKTDDRVAIEQALNNARGATVDGEGLTYAVQGNIEVRTDVDFRNAKLIQTLVPADTTKFLPSAQGQGTIVVSPPEAMRKMVKGLPVMLPTGVGTYAADPMPTDEDLKTLLPGIVLRTLCISGDQDKSVGVRLENIRIDRGSFPQSGGRNDGKGLMIKYGSPVELRDVEVTGDGKGTGLAISNCRQVRIERVNIHDMCWAPYAGDDVLERLTAAEVRDDFRWNNFPIYEYRAALKRFVRVRIQEQVAGMFIENTEDVVIADSKVERLQTKIGDKLYPLQCDGMTINKVKGLVIRNCRITKVWEGIDFTGAAGRDFVYENCVTSDTLGYGFKLAHPKQNGKLINCTAVDGGQTGFVFGGEVENVVLSGCRALETGANGYWVNGEGKRMKPLSGFLIESIGDTNPFPRQIHIEHCAAINTAHPGAMDFGLQCEPKPEMREITVTDFTVVGAATRATDGIEPGLAQTRAAAVATSTTPESEAQVWQDAVYQKYKTWPPFRYVEEDPKLPRVLLIGDSISIGYTTRVQEALKGKANVWRVPTNAGSTRVGLEQIDQWLAWRPKWDVIHFNFGLHDLYRRSADGSSAKPQDTASKPDIALEQYAQNLEQLVTRLERTGAKLIWAATTPVPDGAPGRAPGDEVKYNAAAAKIMQQHGIRIDDLYSYILPNLAVAQNPQDVHFRDEGNTLLAKQVATEIEAALGTSTAK